MLLGILLHGMLSFMPMPIWPWQDLRQSGAYELLNHAIHGFRMPLFFLLSGFFTAMLWKRRGLKALLRHRAKRILVPMILGTLLVWPMMIALGIAGAASKKRGAEQREALGLHKEASVWELVIRGEDEALAALLKADADPNGRDPLGITPLSWAALVNNIEATRLLIEDGADVNARNISDGATPLHAAVFLGRDEIALRLLDAGAKVDARDNQGTAPMDSLNVPMGIVDVVASSLRIDIDHEAVNSGRERTALILNAATASSAGSSEAATQSRMWKEIRDLWTLGAMFPCFHHLWFLYYLCLLLVPFVMFVWMKRRVGFQMPRGLVHSSLRWLWLLPITAAAQWLMRQTFGPDTATGLLPWPPKFFYYSIFFGVGALSYADSAFVSNAGRRWVLWAVLAMPALAAALHFFHHQRESATLHFLYSVSLATYTWLAIYAAIGMFNRFCYRASPRIRYLSDAAYWL
ncbi:MAG: acyltransferase family protein [Verrucomicrobiae bacterium]|nr:acyltransferase family protein [Verrucomicrobiae bacterium]